MTLATMSNNILKLCPGLNLDIVKSNLQDSYRQLCSRDWSRLKLMRQIPTVATYSTGTVSVDVNGIVTPAGGATFSALMVGRFMRVEYADSYFEISAYTAVGGTLTLRSWTGATVAPGETYTIFKTVYTVDVLFGQVFNVIYQTSLGKRSQQYFNNIDPSRSGTGTPTFWAFAGMASTGAIQIEIYPVPTSVLSLRIEGKLKASTLGDSDIPYLPEDLLESHALINCYRLKELSDPQGGWGERAVAQANPNNPVGYPSLLSMYSEEDDELDATVDKVRDAMEEPIIPSDDNFALSHDVD